MNLVTIYSTVYCPYCQRAKELLTRLGIPYKEINLEGNPALRDELRKKYNWHTVPLIVIGEEFIGGYDDLNRLYANGILMKKFENPEA